MMQPALVNATPSDALVEAPAKVLLAYHCHQQMTGRGNTSFTRAARAFLRRWPALRSWEHETLAVQLSANASTRPFITFLLVTGRIHPGWEYQPGWIRPVTSRKVMNGRVLALADNCTARVSCSQDRSAGQRRRNARAARVNDVLPRPVICWWA